MAFDNSGTKAVWAARLGTTPKRCELQLFFAGIRQAVRRWKALHLGGLNMQFKQDCPKDKKNYSCFNFLPENLEKFCSTELNDAPLEGSTIFLYRSSLGHMSLESCWLAELKNAIFSRTGRKTKKLRRSKLFLSTVFKHGFLQGSTILLQYIALTRTSLERSRLGEFGWEISRGCSLAWDHPKRCELPLLFAAIGQAVRCWKALNLRNLKIQFQRDWQKDQKVQLF